MTPSHSKKKDGRHYRYYVCCHAQKRGWANCPCPSIPAEEIEKFVVDQLQSIACQPDFINQILTQTHVQQQSQVVAIETEHAALRRSLTRWNSELQDALPRSTVSPEDPAVLGRLVDLQDRIRNTEQQMTRLREKLVDLKTSRISPQQTATALQQFAPVWGVLTPREQIRVIELLVERVDFDGNKGTVAVTFRPEGLRQFSDESTTAKAAT
jgi:site-specific DNA recombinase